MSSGEAELAVALVARRHEALLAAGHTILAARYLADVCRGHADDEELIARIEARWGAA